MNERFYLLKIQLLDIEPEIWRRFVVPSERACPPEDVGGVPGYFKFCKALKDYLLLTVNRIRQSIII